MELYPVNNAIEARDMLEQCSKNLQEIKKIGDSGNKYRIRTDRDGVNSTPVRNLVIEVEACWIYEGDSIVFTAKLWGRKD